MIVWYEYTVVVVVIVALREIVVSILPNPACNRYHTNATCYIQIVLSISDALHFMLLCRCGFDFMIFCWYFFLLHDARILCTLSLALSRSLLSPSPSIKSNWNLIQLLWHHIKSYYHCHTIPKVFCFTGINCVRMNKVKFICEKFVSVAFR